MFKLKSVKAMFYNKMRIRTEKIKEGDKVKIIKSPNCSLLGFEGVVDSISPDVFTVPKSCFFYEKLRGSIVIRGDKSSQVIIGLKNYKFKKI